MNEHEVNAVFKLIVDRISELAEMRRMMNTESGKAAMDAEMEFLRGIIGKLETNN